MILDVAKSNQIEMGSKKPKPTRQLPSTGNELLRPKSCGYTYADLSNFHRTVIAILNSTKPNTLDKSDLTTVLQYICIVTALIDSAQIFHFSIAGQTQVSNRSSLQYPFPKIKGIGVISRSGKCLRALVIWMRSVVQIRDLTLEILLDEYYTKFPYALKPSISAAGRKGRICPGRKNKKESGKP